MCQKRQILLPVGYKTATPKTGDWEWLWRQFRTPSLAKNRFQSFSYCALINLLRNGTIVHCLWENKTSEKSVFREAWSPELTSQSFPVPCFWSHGFVPHWKWNLMLLVHQNTEKENRYGKTFLLYLSVHWEDLIEQIKKICHIHFKTLWKLLQYWKLVYY